MFTGLAGYLSSMEINGKGQNRRQGNMKYATRKLFRESLIKLYYVILGQLIELSMKVSLSSPTTFFTFIPEISAPDCQIETRCNLRHSMKVE